MAAPALVNDSGVAGLPLLRLEDVVVVYDRSILALRGLSLHVDEGQVVALLGANGAGKTTALKAVSNLLAGESGEVTHGRIEYRGTDITCVDPASLVRRGVVQVLEGRRCFAHLSVEENLIMGDIVTRRGRSDLHAEIDRMYSLFPRLRDLRHRSAGYLSGGEQQMLAIARALMTPARLVLLDEPSMGLAPQVVEEIFEIVRQLNQRDGVSFLVAEQNAVVALQYAHHGYLLENGRAPSDGTAEDLLAREDVSAFYLGGRAANLGPPARTRARRPEFAVGAGRTTSSESESDRRSV